MNTKPSIITVTLNPAIDHSVFVDQLLPGTVHRATDSHRQAGGKGVNVATMLALGGASVAVTGFLGEDNPAIFETHFKRHALQDNFIRVPGETRTGIKIIDAQANDTTDLNLPGPAPSSAQCEGLLSTLLQQVQAGTWVVIAGSLPRGVEPAFLLELIPRLREAGAKVAIDSSGAALKAAVAAGVDLAKPNEHELAELLDAKFDDFQATLEAARKLCRERIPNLIVSLGGDGALFLTEDSELMASAPPVNVISTVGAGDSLLAGYLQGRLAGAPLEDCARRATVYAWSRLESLVSALPAPDELQQRMARVRVQTIASGDAPSQ
ncbi:1-phosphofructokinase [Coraliomargarita algicola]|uniref:1-phosphofructokinase n=1 Tax=Coraliomargarita algicola TaxID=3092156 RepID=A0ABZ0RPK0_9BACT|nr:1-phosphofructokinase [Coraliomargarita sp. J2-16]WPJ98174.1 1-phosphofructokinase [Coraliomargarita sp. J2-16]